MIACAIACFCIRGGSQSEGIVEFVNRLKGKLGERILHRATFRI